jgi:putative tricarboxylic transport membrane protein
VTSPDVEEATRPAASWAQLAFAAVILLLGVVVLTEGLGVRGDLSPQGPRFFPTALGVLWLVLGVLYLASRIRVVASGTPDESTERLTHVKRLAVLAVLLVGYVYVLYPLGYVLSTALFFIGAAAALGSTHHRRDVVVGVLLSVAVYFVFSRMLGISLPPGVLPL